MFKLVLFVAFCTLVVAESQPTTDDDFLTRENIRVERDTEHMQNAMHVAGQIAHGGLEVANKGAHLLTAAAKKAMSAGSTLAAAAAKSAITLL